MKSDYIRDLLIISSTLQKDGDYFVDKELLKIGWVMNHDDHVLTSLVTVSLYPLQLVLC
jgi:hypothetical protein